jgi:hypothetical protein
MILSSEELNYWAFVCVSVETNHRCWKAWGDLHLFLQWAFVYIVLKWVFKVKYWILNISKCVSPGPASCTALYCTELCRIWQPSVDASSYVFLLSLVGQYVCINHSDITLCSALCSSHANNAHIRSEQCPHTERTMPTYGANNAHTRSEQYPHTERTMPTYGSKKL